MKTSNGPDSRSQRIRRILAESPATCEEIALELEISIRRARVAMWILTHTGMAEKMEETTEGKRNTRRNLYRLTRRGFYAIRVADKRIAA